jgi:hypothetical protein
MQPTLAEALCTPMRQQKHCDAQLAIYVNDVVRHATAAAKAQVAVAVARQSPQVPVTHMWA